eukprot:4857-Heterococcus_DN1.PRE.2
MALADVFSCQRCSFVRDCIVVGVDLYVRGSRRYRDSSATKQRTRTIRRLYQQICSSYAQ